MNDTTAATVERNAPSREGRKVGIAVEKGTVEVSSLEVLELK